MATGSKVKIPIVYAPCGGGDHICRVSVEAERRRRAPANGVPASALV